MFRLHKAAIVRPHGSENLEKKNYNYSAVAMAGISPLRKAYVTDTSRKHFYNV